MPHEYITDERPAPVYWVEVPEEPHGGYWVNRADGNRVVLDYDKDGRLVEDPKVIMMTYRSPVLGLVWQDSDSAQFEMIITRRQLEQMLESMPEEGELAFYTEPMTRPELNKAIRLTRRARIKVYGEDE